MATSLVPIDQLGLDMEGVLDALKTKSVVTWTLPSDLGTKCVIVRDVQPGAIAEHATVVEV